MDREEQRHWKNEALDQVLKCLAHSPSLNEALIFKGARILSLFLGGGGRRSFDLDANASSQLERQHPQTEERGRWLEREITRALTRGLERDEPIRYRLEGVRVARSPPRGHPRGWDGWEITLSIQDLRRRVLGLPSLRLDVSAPDALNEASVVNLELAGCSFRAYSLERIAGEKLRAFLYELPEHRLKIHRRRDSRRVKDIYDLAAIARARPVGVGSFWNAVGEQLQLACQSRYVDCAGIETFEQELSVTRDLYEKEPTLPDDIPFTDAWANLRSIVSYLEALGLFPLRFPFPDEMAKHPPAR